LIYSSSYSKENLFASDGSVSIEGKAFLLGKHPLLEEMQQHTRLGNNRYEHTLILLESFYRLVNNDYAHFIRLAERISHEGTLSTKQFQEMKAIAKQVLCTERDQFFFYLLLLTHDYGAIDGESRHFIKSGTLCVPEFEQAEFNNTKIELAKIIVGNHSYMGDLLLGEGNITYGLELYSKIEVLSSTPEKYWKMLWLLTLIDINAAGEGFLSNYRYTAIKQVDRLEGLSSQKTDWYKNRYQYLGKDKNFYAQYKNKLSPNLKDVYLQYFHNIANLIDDLSLISILNHCSEFLQIRDSGRLAKFSFITFSRDTKEFLPNILKIAQLDQTITLTSKTAGVINGIEFNITDDGYLEFKVD